jgi:hypothetical protein
MSSAFEAQFLFAKTPILARLKRLTELQSRARRAGFQDLQKQEISDALDKIASAAESRAKLLDDIEAKATGNVEKAVALLRLCSGGVLTEGRLMTRARNTILSCMGQSGFMTGYVAHTARAKGEPANADTATTELLGSLQKAGITAETGLKSIAA